MLQFHIQVDTEKMDKFLASAKADLQGSGQGPIRRAMRQWSVRYFAFILRRFNIFSRGGGDWAPLAPSTKAARRKASKKNNKRGWRIFSILLDDGILRGALFPGSQTGKMDADIVSGVRVGFSEIGKHGKTTINNIAQYHQSGGPNLPKREIIVHPDQKTADAMSNDLARGMQRAING